MKKGKFFLALLFSLIFSILTFGGCGDSGSGSGVVGTYYLYSETYASGTHRETYVYKDEEIYEKVINLEEDGDFRYFLRGSEYSLGTWKKVGNTLEITITNGRTVYLIENGDNTIGNGKLSFSRSGDKMVLKKGEMRTAAGSYEPRIPSAINGETYVSLKLYPDGECYLYGTYGTWMQNGSKVSLTFDSFMSTGERMRISGTLNGDALTISYDGDRETLYRTTAPKLYD